MTSHEDQDTACVLQLKNLPNLRVVPIDDAEIDSVPSDDTGVTRPRQSKACRLFRSSRPDALTDAELRLLKDELKIKTIVDLRSEGEYYRSTGRIVDRHYSLRRAHCPNKRNSAGTSEIKVTNLNPEPDNISGGVNHVSDTHCHYLINFFQFDYFIHIYASSPWYFKLYSPFLLLADVTVRSNIRFKYFVRSLAKVHMNKTGILQQYKDMIDHSQTAIRTALKLLSDRENLPALLNCAIGKDRTGVVTALLLKLCGKSHAYIAADYAKSQKGLDPIRDRVRKDLMENLHLSQDFTEAKPDTMLELLEYIEQRYGGVQQYMIQIGFGEEEQESLKQNLMG